MSARRDTVETAERLLASSDRSAARLEADLRERGISPDEAMSLIAELERVGLLSDERAAARRAARLAERGWGNAAIEHTLETERYRSEAVAQALAVLSSEIERAHAALGARRRTRAEAVRFLSRRGFDPEVCERIFAAEQLAEG